MKSLADSTSGSALSDPDSNVESSGLKDEIVVGGGSGRKAPEISRSARSCYPKRKRSSLLNSFNESNLESVHTATPKRSSTSSTSANELKLSHQSIGSPKVKDLRLGAGKVLNVYDEKNQSDASFTDSRDRLRARIQPNVKSGESFNWAALDHVVRSDDLVGLNDLQVKENARPRYDAVPKEAEGGCAAPEHAAIEEHICSVKEPEALVQSPSARFDIYVPDCIQAPASHTLKRRRIRSGFATISQAPTENVPETAAVSSPLKSIAADQAHRATDPTRPTRILVGYWKSSSEVDPKDRHAAHGVLGKHDVLRFKVIPETRDGRYVFGNYPFGTGAMWIPYEDVEFEPHLKALSRQEIQEYCRIRQYRLDHGETSVERIQNETKAAKEARIRVDAMSHKQPCNATVAAVGASLQSDNGKNMIGLHVYGSFETCQSCTTESSSIQTLAREDAWNLSRFQNAEATETGRALAYRKCVGGNAALGRAIRHALQRECAMAVPTVGATDAVIGAREVASNVSPKYHLKTNTPLSFRKSEDMQRLSKTLDIRQTLRMTSNPDDVKTYDGNRYGRKETGPLVGKLVSQSTIIKIDGDDHVEYRVITKPLFF